VRTWFNQLFRYALVTVPETATEPASDLDVVAVPLPPVNHNPFLQQSGSRRAREDGPKSPGFRWISVEAPGTSLRWKVVYR
jgi:hypothetical protein